MNIHMLPDSLRNCLHRLHTAGYEAYIVGGGVKQLLQKLPVTDGDITTSATPEQIQELFPDSFCENPYGTVTVKSLAVVPPISRSEKDKVLLYEITPYRVEGVYNDRRHPQEVRWAQTLAEDLARRDFTINAIAYDGDKFVDLWGGRNDFQNRLIRAVGNPDDRFAEDALRMMRAVRFSAQLGFLIEPETHASIKRNAALVQKLSAERVRDELLKIISSSHPADGILFLRSSGLLAYVLPELDRCFQIDQRSPNRHHIYDVGTHCVMALRHCDSSDTMTRFATLLHDIGKYETFQKDPQTGQVTFYNHEYVSARQCKDIARRLKLSRVQSEQLWRLVVNHQFVVSKELTDNAIRRFIRNVGREYLDEMFALRRADRLGGAAAESSWRTELFKKRVTALLVEPFTVRDLKIDGTDVMHVLHMKPGPRVGALLQEMFQLVESKSLENTREALLAYLTKYQEIS